MRAVSAFLILVLIISTSLVVAEQVDPSGLGLNGGGPAAADFKDAADEDKPTKPLTIEERLQRLEDKEAVREFVARYETVVNDIVNGYKNLSYIRTFINKHFTDDCLMAGQVEGKEDARDSLTAILRQFRFLRHYVGGTVVSHINTTHATVEGPIGVVGTYNDGQPFASSMYVAWQLRKVDDAWKFQSDTGYFDFWVRLQGLWGEQQQQADYYAQQQAYEQQQYAQQQAYEQQQYAQQQYAQQQYPQGQQQGQQQGQ